MPPERTDRYKQLHILVDPSPVGPHCYVRVVARVSDRGVNRDRVLSERRLDIDLGQHEVAETLRLAGELIVAEAFRMAQPAPQAPHREDPFYRRVEDPEQTKMTL